MLSPEDEQEAMLNGRFQSLSLLKAGGCHLLFSVISSPAPGGYVDYVEGREDGREVLTHYLALS